MRSSQAARPDSVDVAMVEVEDGVVRRGGGEHVATNPHVDEVVEPWCGIRWSPPLQAVAEARRGDAPRGGIVRELVQCRGYLTLVRQRRGSLPKCPSKTAIGRAKSAINISVNLYAPRGGLAQEQKHRGQKQRSRQPFAIFYRGPSDLEEAFVEGLLVPRERLGPLLL